jgi:diguanylate cyclase (GGDEF)-like protein
MKKITPHANAVTGQDSKGLLARIAEAKTPSELKEMLASFPMDKSGKRIVLALWEENKILCKKNTDLKNISEALSKDTVTNYRRFEVFKEDLKKIEKTKQPYALISLDIDGFKAINDDYSPKEADKVLKRIADIIHGEFSENFARPHGDRGDEFLIVIPQCKNVEAAAARAEILRNKIERGRFEVMTPKGREKIKVTISAGVAFSFPGHSLNSVKLDADKALSKSKKTGGRVLTLLHGNSCFYMERSGKLVEFQYPNVQNNSLQKGQEALITTFDPDKIARIVINGLEEKFKKAEDATVIRGESEKDTLIRKRNIRFAATMIQAGARGLVPPEKREKSFRPVLEENNPTRVKKFAGEPDSINKAQQLYLDLDLSGQEATEKQKRFFLDTIQEAARLLDKCGCKEQALDIGNFVELQRREFEKEEPNESKRPSRKRRLKSKKLPEFRAH